MTKRDIEIFMLLKKFGYVREDLIALHCNMDYSTDSSKSILSRIFRRLNKYLVKVKYIFDKPFYWSLNKEGCYFMDSKISKTINYNNIVHDDLVTELGIYFLKNSNQDIETEFEIKQNLSIRDIRNKKIPDIILNENTAIEVEISRKDESRLITIINNYNMSNYEKIIYYSNSQVVINRLYKYTKNNNKFILKTFSKNINEAKDFTYTDTNILRENSTGKFKSENEFMKRISIVGERKNN